jgi:hypothetical protein
MHKKVYLAEKEDACYSELQIYLNNKYELFVSLDDGDGYGKFTVLPLSDAKDIIADLLKEIGAIPKPYKEQPAKV